MKYLRSARISWDRRTRTSA